MVKGADVSPDVGVLLETRGECVVKLDGGVAIDFELGAVVGGEEWEDESADGMGAEVGGDVADAEAAIEGGIYWVQCKFFELCVALCPGAVLGEEGGLCAMRVEIECVEEIAVDRGIVRSQFNRATEAGDGLLDATHVLEDVAHRVVGLGWFGIKRDGAGDGFESFVE